MAFTAASQQLFSLRQARNASTQSTIPAAATNDPSFLGDVTGTPVSLTGSDLLDIPEQIGFLKTLGLDYGWGPTAFMQSALESVYVYTGLPWWATIGVIAVGIRLALLKPALDASENSIKYNELSKDPRYIAALEEMKTMMVTGNHLAGAEARAKVTLMNKAAGYSLWKNFVPMLQLPIGIGMFRLIKGMSELPVPSFEAGGLLWFTDLTVADPLFILPIATGILMMAGMRVFYPPLTRGPLSLLTPRELDTAALHGSPTAEDDEDDECRHHADFYGSCALPPVRPHLVFLAIGLFAYCPIMVPSPALVPKLGRTEAVEDARCAGCGGLASAACRRHQRPESHNGPTGCPAHFRVAIWEHSIHNCGCKGEAE